MNAQTLILLMTFAAGMFSGGIPVHYVMDARITQIKDAYIKQHDKAETLARQRLEEAVAEGNELASRLAQTESTLNKQAFEVSHEIAQHTSGRACLSASAVRLLNHPDSRAASMPGAAKQLDAKSETAATDTDIANWIINTQSQYETCRSRLAALIDWWEPAKP